MSETKLKPVKVQLAGLYGQMGRTNFQLSGDIATICDAVSQKFGNLEDGITTKHTRTEKELFIIEQCAKYDVKPVTIFKIIF